MSRTFATGLTARLYTATNRPLRNTRCRNMNSVTAMLASSRHHYRVKVQPMRWVVPCQRSFTTTPQRQHGHVTPPKPGDELWITFIDKDGEEFKFAVSEGDNLLDIAQANDLEMEGACGGSCACSTCHVIVTDESLYDKIPDRKSVV